MAGSEALASIHADAATVESILRLASGGGDDEGTGRSASAPPGVRTESLRVTHHHDGFTVSVAGRTRGRLDRGAAAELLREHPVPVTDWRYWRSLRRPDGSVDDADHSAPPPGAHGVAWLRWLEGADGGDSVADGGVAGDGAADGGGAGDGAADGSAAGDGADGGATASTDGDAHASAGSDTDGGADALPGREPRSRYRALAAGIDREWGELAVHATLAPAADGERRYELRHRRDAGTDPAELTAYERPRRARELATFDERGRYRPLKTAPTLQRGWRFSGLTGPQLVQAVEFLYPATVANWHRERQGELDVTHYRETAARQTGIYGVIDELTPENVAHLAETCCADSQCLRRREWDEDAETPLDVPRGEGQFPCREPCSLVVAAARTFTTAQDETPREYTFELTPTEKNQLERLLEAVADGEIDEIREADLNDGANRYRARYLRARRLTERGLCDVPTFEDG